jgi:hypothetical protein
MFGKSKEGASMKNAGNASDFRLDKKAGTKPMAKYEKNNLFKVLTLEQGAALHAEDVALLGEDVTHAIENVAKANEAAILAAEEKKAALQNSEFAHAAKHGKLLRHALKPVMVSDTLAVSRLVKCFLNIIKQDVINPPGKRVITTGAMGSLYGFNFNIKAQLDSLFKGYYEISFQREYGQILLTIPSFDLSAIAYPKNASYFQIFSAGCEIDFTKGTYICDFQQTPLIPLNRTTPSVLVNGKTRVMRLLHCVTPKSIHPLLLVLGLRFYDNWNNQFLGQTLCPLKIVGVDCVKNNLLKK